MKNIVTYLIGLILLATNLFAQNQNPFQKPAVQRLVVDNAKLFNEQQIAKLEEKLYQLNAETSTQILVYTTPDLQGYEVADFAQKLGHGWGIGSDKFDNGIVIVVKPRINNSPGRVTIQTGYGIEALIPDATANRIIDQEIIPQFKNGLYYDGINAAVDICISLTKGEFKAEEYAKKENPIAAIFIIIVFLVVFFSMFSRKRGNYYNTGHRSNLPLWTALFLLGSSSGKGSGWSNFSSGSGSFGGGSSFGGFGGGGFGGGGASGSW
jgi:uncharacterized protein